MKANDYNEALRSLLAPFGLTTQYIVSRNTEDDPEVRQNIKNGTYTVAKIVSFPKKLEGLDALVQEQGIPKDAIIDQKGMETWIIHDHYEKDLRNVFDLIGKQVGEPVKFKLVYPRDPACMPRPSSYPSPSKLLVSSALY